MPLVGYTFDKMPINAANDAMLNYGMTSGVSSIIKNVGNELKPTISGLNINVATGAAIIQGRLVHNNTPASVTCPIDSLGYVVIELALNLTNTSTGTPGTGDYTATNYQVSLKTVTSLLQPNTINNNKAIYHFPICVFQTDGEKVTDILPMDGDTFEANVLPPFITGQTDERYRLFLKQQGRIITTTGSVVTGANGIAKGSNNQVTLLPTYLRPKIPQTFVVGNYTSSGSVIQALVQVLTTGQLFLGYPTVNGVPGALSQGYSFPINLTYVLY